MACKTTTILDFENVEYEKFIKNSTLSNHEFDRYSKGGFLFFAYIVRGEYKMCKDQWYPEYQLHLAVYSQAQQLVDVLINKVELLSTDGTILFAKNNIQYNELLKSDNNNLFAAFVQLMTIPPLQLPKAYYTVKIYFSDYIFTYEFYPRERRYSTSISQ
jgi:hypothetical protein